MAMGDIAYVDRPLYDYVQHSDAALGHARANLGAQSGVAQRVRTAKSGRVLAGWGLVYHQHHPRLLLAATVLKLRFGDDLAGDRAKAIDRILHSDSLRGAAWLMARAVRARLGATETMQRDSNLLRAIAWLRIVRAARTLRTRRALP